MAHAIYDLIADNIYLSILCLSTVRVFLLFQSVEIVEIELEISAVFSLRFLKTNFINLAVKLKMCEVIFGTFCKMKRILRKNLKNEGKLKDLGLIDSVGLHKISQKIFRARYSDPAQIDIVTE